MKVVTKLAMVLSLCVSMSAYSDDASAQKPGTSEKIKHYITHCITDPCVRWPAFISALVALGMGIKVDETQRRMDMQESFRSWERSPESAPKLTNPYPFLVVAALGLFATYKTPQWTDKYILGKKTKRTTGENIFNFLVRGFFLGSPLGVCLGEALSDPFKSVDEKAEPSK